MTFPAPRPTLVSVIIPAFDAERTIGDALRSALGQTFGALEILVVDDASRDRTALLAAEIAGGDPRVRLLRNDRNLGPAASRNRGLAEARGRYAAFLDADDEWLPEKLARQVAALEANPRALLCCCNALWVRDGAVEGAVYDRCTVASGPDSWKAMLEDVYVATPCAVVDTAAARRLGGFDATLRVGEDQDLWLRLAFAGEVIALPDTLARCRRHDGSYMDRHRTLSTVDWLPRLEAHVTAHRGRLTEGERDHILRAIYLRMGNNSCRNGLWRAGLPLLGRALRHGASPLLVCELFARILALRLLKFGMARARPSA